MIATYKDYLPQFKSIDFETCLKVHDMMIEEIGDNEDAIELYNEIVEKSIEYTSIRAYWTIKDREWKINNDPARTAKHDAIIIKYNQLARYLKMQGKTAEWRDILGYVEDERKIRKRIGDMSNFLTYIHALAGR